MSPAPLEICPDCISAAVLRRVMCCAGVERAKPLAIARCRACFLACALLLAMFAPALRLRNSSRAERTGRYASRAPALRGGKQSASIYMPHTLRQPLHVYRQTGRAQYVLRHVRHKYFVILTIPEPLQLWFVLFDKLC